MTENVIKKKLTPEQYKIAREGGTEAPFSGLYWDERATGVYRCAVCSQELFSSNTKFESSAPGLQGWPAFSDPINRQNVILCLDDSDGMQRTEVICKKCGSHLGHLFEEVPGEEAERHYCINSVCLVLEKK